MNHFTATFPVIIIIKFLHLVLKNHVDLRHLQGSHVRLHDKFGVLSNI